MGNALTKTSAPTNATTTNIKQEEQEEKQFNNFYQVIDYIATHYILTMNFKSLRQLSQKEYCDKLVILTSEIIEKYFNEKEVTYLAQKLKNGQEVNELDKQKVIYINKEHLDRMDVSNDTQKNVHKKRMCIGIAKHYVKIAHVFAAIVMTINPVYTYKDATGQTVKTGLLHKDKIPKNTERKIYKLNICDNRIRAMKRNERFDQMTKQATIQPKICDINTSKKTLAEEPGIAELMTLYLDDKYDYSNGLFTGMSATTEAQFKRDLKLFYTAFTGKDEMPAEITKFGDIKLRDYASKSGCQGKNAVLNQKYTMSSTDKLLVQYAENTKEMIQHAADNQHKLLTIINELFVFVIDPYSKKRVIRIHPNLTETTLQQVVEKTRKYIVDLYVKCEEDYVRGVQLYEAIVESKILETTQKQIDALKKETGKIIQEVNRENNVNYPFSLK